MMDRAGNIMRLLFDRRLIEQGEQYGSLFGSWGAVAGEQIAAHSEITDIRNGVVVVVADHPGWIQLLQLKQHSVLEELRRRFPELGIRALRIQLPHGEQPVGPRSAAASGAPEEVGPPAIGGTGARFGSAPGPIEAAEATEAGASSPAPPVDAGSEAEPVTRDPALELIRDDELRELLKRIAGGIERRTGR